MTMASFAVPAPSATTCETATFLMMTFRSPAISSSMPEVAPTPTPRSVLSEAM